MVQDSVREELATKIGRTSKPLEWNIVEEAKEKMAASTGSADVIAYAEREPGRAIPNPPVVERRPKADPTERISRHTSPTLVGFQNPKSNVPDWRLQLQNSIRQRKAEPAIEQPLIPGLHTHLVTNGNTALKAQYKPEPEPAVALNPKLANVLERIEASRRRFTGEPAEAAKAPSPPTTKTYPFDVVEGNGSNGSASARPATVNTLPKPRLVSTTAITPRKGLDTNKLPPIPEIETSSMAHATPIEYPKIEEPAYAPVKIEIRASEPELAEPEASLMQTDLEEIDDLAPLSNRVIAGLFDAIICGFGTAILMSPLLVRGGEWLSFAGILAIGAAFGIVMFSYMTIGVGLRGRTLGMKIFALEVIDIEANEYPTFHQAAVRSAVFLLSLPLLGIGFLTAFFNDERRAAHDLVSGTILVREL
jgi:uncharacterized RDD family membrane protein YckC